MWVRSNYSNLMVVRQPLNRCQRTSEHLLKLFKYIFPMQVPWIVFHAVFHHLDKYSQPRFACIIWPHAFWFVFIPTSYEHSILITYCFLLCGNRCKNHLVKLLAGFLLWAYCQLSMFFLETVGCVFHCSIYCAEKPNKYYKKSLRCLALCHIKV